MSANGTPTARRWAAETDILRTLLAAELAACEAYRSAILAVERDEGVSALSLRCLHRSHRKAAEVLRGFVRAHGGRTPEPDVARDAWADVHDRVAATDDPERGVAILRGLRRGERATLALARGALLVLSGLGAHWVGERHVRSVAANVALLDALVGPAGDGESR